LTCVILHGKISWVVCFPRFPNQFINIKGKKMKIVTLFIMALSFSSVCLAGKPVVDVWNCKLKEGKTMKEAGALNDKWVKFMNANVKGGGINSYDLVAIVGNHNGFMYVDTYPNIKAWAASDNVMESSDEGKALTKQFREIAKCSNNTLYSSTKH